MCLIDSLRRNTLLALTFGLALAASAPAAHANVYATNIRLNGSPANTVVLPGDGVTISYILNEPASLGVNLQIISGTQVVRSLDIVAGNPGTLRGLNSISWDGKDDAGNLVTNGVHSVKITAAATGYADWAQLSDDANEGNYVYEGRGIAVNRDPKSPYFGRVFVANSATPAAGGTKPGDQVGILKLNADGSAAEEGIFSTGGHGWAGDTYSPWHLEVSDDGFVYINDWTRNGEVFRWDSVLSTDSMLAVLREDNWGNGGVVSLSGPTISGTGANTTVWMTDVSFNSLGVVKYTVAASGAVTVDDKGTTVVADPAVAFYDVAVDKSTNIYTIQFITGAADSNPRVLRYSASDLATPAWTLGTNDDTMGRASGVAVDPTGTFLAVAFRGIDDSSGFGWTNGCTQIFYATNGALAVNLDLGKTLSGGTTHEDTDCAWDAVGNVYYIDNLHSIWRAFSPPGTNQATTVAPQTLEVAAQAEVITITGIRVEGGTVGISFKGRASDPAAAFTLLTSDSPNGTYVAESNTVFTAGQNAGEFAVTVATNGAARFYRVGK